MWRSRWKPGGAQETDGPVLISVTEFTAAHLRDVPAIWWEGARLRQAWPRLEGAVGTWLWFEVLGRRSGSVSVWKREEDLRRFVRWPPHLRVVRRFQGRGTLASTSWRAAEFDPRKTWEQAARWIQRRSHAHDTVDPYRSSH